MTNHEAAATLRRIAFALESDAAAELLAPTVNVTIQPTYDPSKAPEAVVNFVDYWGRVLGADESLFYPSHLADRTQISRRGVAGSAFGIVPSEWLETERPEWLEDQK